MLNLEDKLAINELINLYAHIVDRQAFSELVQIFTNDAVFDLSHFQAGRAYNGLLEIEAMMMGSKEHPVAHHATNIVINPTYGNDQEIKVESKGLGVGRNGRVGSVVYKDVLIKAEGRWRINHRQVQHLVKPGEQH